MKIIRTKDKYNWWGDTYIKETLYMLNRDSERCFVFNITIPEEHTLSDCTTSQYAIL